MFDWLPMAHQGFGAAPRSVARTRFLGLRFVGLEQQVNLELRNWAKGHWPETCCVSSGFGREWRGWEDAKSEPVFLVPLHSYL